MTVSPAPPRFMGRDLWAKTTSRTADAAGFPLHAHLADVAGVVDAVVDRWVPEGAYVRLSDSLGHDLREVVLVCAAAHDIGKAGPFFQHMVPHLAVGLPDAGLADTYVPHTEVSAWALGTMLRDVGCPRATRRGFEMVVAGHHGRFPTEQSRRAVLGLESPQWQSHREELLRFVLDQFDVGDLARFAGVRWEPWTVSVVTGLVIVADWIGSDTALFPTGTDASRDHAARAQRAADMLDLGSAWSPGAAPEATWARRFGLDEGTELNPLQRAVIEHAGPGLTIVEHETGGGKTAAALVAAERIAYEQGRSGIYVALPTRTTASAMFSTVVGWLDYAPGQGAGPVTSLVHGKADQDPEFARVMEGASPGATYSAWYRKKKALLTPVAVGTVDHVLMASLKTNHVMLRHVGLLSKTVVIDEVHSSDTYMETYLRGLVEWCGALGVPVIALSATLSNRRRDLLVDAYRAGQGRNPGADATTATSRGASRITRVDSDGDVRTVEVPAPAPGRRVDVELVGDEPDLDTLVDTVADHGGVVGLIADTVTRAQDWYTRLRDRAAAAGVEVVLLHSRFTDTDRASREHDLVTRCGRASVNRPQRMIVVSTQVVEQALDIDFDYMVTDIAPVDALVQRMGRVHRHTRVRPTVFERARVAVCGVSGSTFARGVDRVYSRYLLLRTLQWLRGRDHITTPDDVAGAMDTVFNLDVDQIEFDDDIAAVIDDAARGHDNATARDHNLSVRTVLPGTQGPVSTLTQWAYASTSDNDTYSGVRAPDGSVEVELTGTVTGTLRVPHWLHTDARVAELTRRDTVVVEVDDDGCFDLGRGRLRYDQELGLVVHAE